MEVKNVDLERERERSGFGGVLLVKHNGSEKS